MDDERQSPRRRFAARAIGGVLLAVVAVAGCTLGRTADRDVADALKRSRSEAAREAAAYSQVRWRAPSGAGDEAGLETPADNEPRTDAAVAPEPVSLRGYIRDALEHNPEIRAAEETALAQAARVPQATALPDPMVTTRTLPEPVRTAEGDNFFNLGVSIRLPVPEKLDRAGRAALQEARMAIQELQRVRLNVIADVKRAYFRIYVIDRTLDVERANQDLLRGLIDVALAQAASGRRGQDDVLRAQVELANLEGEIIELRQQRATAVAMLNRVLNRPAMTPVPEVENFDARSVEAQIDELLAAASAHNPSLQRLVEQIERDRQRAALARLAWWPDFTVGVEWMYMRPRDAFVPPPNPQTGMVPVVSRMSESGTDNWGITFGFNLPIWVGKIEGGIREARSRVRASQKEYVAAQNRVRFEIEDALARVRAQRDLADLFSDTIVPQAQQAFEVSRAAYTGGEGDFLIVIDNWQKWLMFTVQYHRALGELERSVADLEVAIGVSVSELERRS